LSELRLRVEGGGGGDCCGGVRVGESASREYDLLAMNKVDWEKERQRLTERYFAMEDGELNKIAADWDSLSDAARDVLQAELSRRGLQMPVQRTEMAQVAKRQAELPMPEILRRYRDLTEALVAKSILDSAEIESFLADDNLVRMDWLHSNLISGVKLLVCAKDADAANELLDEIAPTQFDVEGLGEYLQPKCPKCGSMDVSDNVQDKYVKAAGFIPGLPLKSTRPGWTCQSCGDNWDDDDAPSKH
jgi:Putative prokaryotic signal transducing protein